MPNGERPVVILGAGVIGLTTAIRLLESPTLKGRPVHVLADHLPSDPLDARYASSAAGAHHLSFADDGDKRQRRWDMRTFKVMYDEWRRDGEASGLMALTQTESWVGSASHLKIYEEHPDLLDPKTAPSPVDHMVSFTSLTITPALYLARLEARATELGAKLHRFHLFSLVSLATPPVLALLGAAPSAIFICAGLGAKTLGGVADPAVFPTRGQVVHVRAPWVRNGYTRQVGSLAGGEGGSRTYVIPRCTGEVILGGTREEGDWDPYPREEVTRDILKRAREICPEIAPPHARSRALDGEGGLEDAWREDTGEDCGMSALEGIVEGVVVGFRPSRVGGTRLERVDLRLNGESLGVVFNYGHGGAGWQSSWGCAEDAVALWEGKARL